MPGTRASARRASTGSSSLKSDDGAAGTKRKAQDEASPKREQKAPKKQTTIEDTIGKKEDDIFKDNDNDKSSGAVQDVNKDDINSDETKDQAKNKEKSNVEESGAVQESAQLEKKMPSNVLEKGIIYFFTRNRVGIEDAESVGDLARTYFALRPLPIGAKLSDGPIPDLKNNRLFALPKKVLPKSHSDRFMAFVEKANTTVQDLKDNFFKGEEYETKTQGTRHVEPITTVAEGVYAITRSEDRTTHLAYATTIPSELGEVQEDLGVRSQGSFIISVKNPERPGPASARLPKAPEFPKDIIEDFRGLAWSEVKPKYLDYENCQILLIGEDIKKAIEPTTKDRKHDKDTPKEVLEVLEHEDELRTQNLHGDDSVFDDLNISKKDYPKVPTTW